MATVFSHQLRVTFLRYEDGNWVLDSQLVLEEAFHALRAVPNAAPSRLISRMELFYTDLATFSNRSSGVEVYVVGFVSP